MDAIALLGRDHRDIDALFERFVDARGDEERRAITESLITALSVHAEIERLLLYPLVSTLLAGGEQTRTRCLDEHETVERILSDVESMLEHGAVPAFTIAVGQLYGEVAAHAKEEERQVFPALREAVTPARLQHLGREMAAARRAVPTRPRPPLADDVATHDVVGRAAGAVDHARDRRRL